MYSGSEKESFLQTRIRMYDKQKIKSSFSILPDESSTYQHLKRSDLQALVWYQCTKQMIQYPSLVDRGWEENEDGIRPIWYSCSQLPPTLLLSAKQLTKSVVPPPKKKAKQTDDTDVATTNPQENISDSESDTDDHYSSSSSDSFSLSSEDSVSDSDFDSDGSAQSL